LMKWTTITHPFRNPATRSHLISGSTSIISMEEISPKYCKPISRENSYMPHHRPSNRPISEKLSESTRALNCRKFISARPIQDPLQLRTEIFRWPRSNSPKLLKLILNSSLSNARKIKIGWMQFTFACASMRTYRPLWRIARRYKRRLPIQWMT
jgi:hypothetical protein